MLNRRHLLTFTSGAALAGLTPWRGARAQGAATHATAFVKQAGARLLAVVNGPGSTAQKRQAMAGIVDQIVDVEEIARFCLGRFWRQATAEQKKRYVALFHEVLVTSITSKLGEYQGVTFQVGRAVPDDSNVKVATVVHRPQNPPTNVQWVIENPASDPKIIDVIAEGTSLRLTQRSDYESYLAHNGNSIDALISAMHRQIAQNQTAG